MRAAELIQLWLQERGYNLVDIYMLTDRLSWIRPPKGPGLFLWFKGDNTSVTVSQKIDAYADMNAKTFNIGDPNLFEYLGEFFPYDTRYGSVRPSDGMD